MWQSTFDFLKFSIVAEECSVQNMFQNTPP